MSLVSVFLLIISLLHAVDGNIQRAIESAAKFDKIVQTALVACPGKVDKKTLHRYGEDFYPEWQHRKSSTSVYDESNLACRADFFCRYKPRTSQEVGKTFGSAAKHCGEIQIPSALAPESLVSDHEVLPESTEVLSENFEYEKEDLDGREVLLSMTKGNLMSFLFGLLFGFLINYLYRGTLSPTTMPKVLRRPEL